MQAQVCNVCGYVYEEGRYGHFEDLDEDWTCPNCGSEIDTFELKEVEEE